MKRRCLAVVLTVCLCTSCVTTIKHRGTQNIDINSRPAGAKIWKEDESGKWKVGHAPTTLMAEYETETEYFSPGNWLWLLLPGFPLMLSTSLLAALPDSSGDDDDGIDKTPFLATAIVSGALTLGLGIYLLLRSSATEESSESTTIDISAEKPGYKTEQFTLTVPMPSPQVTVTMEALSGKNAQLASRKGQGQGSAEQRPTATTSEQRDRSSTADAEGVSSPPSIWLISIGISEFNLSAHNLEYAATDASAFYRTFRSASGKILPKNQAVLLKDAAATRVRVVGTMAKLASSASPEDLLVVFLATRARPDPDTNEITFLMHDSDPDNLLGTGLTQGDLRGVLKSSPVRKVLFIVDSAHAGAVGAGELAVRRGVELSEINRLVAGLAEAVHGTAVFSASSSNEASHQDPRWNGGVFTYYLLSGLQGKADANQDGLVTLRELYDFVYRQVSRATGDKQHPELKGYFSNELPMAVIDP
jgi:hypothetical protein